MTNYSKCSTTETAAFITHTQTYIDNIDWSYPYEQQRFRTPASNTKRPASNTHRSEWKLQPTTNYTTLLPVNPTGVYRSENQVIYTFHCILKRAAIFNMMNNNIEHFCGEKSVNRTNDTTTPCQVFIRKYMMEFLHFIVLLQGAPNCEFTIHIIIPTSTCKYHRIISFCTTCVRCTGL